jgi:uncharacterized protein (TIGR01777 family)
VGRIFLRDESESDREMTIALSGASGMLGLALNQALRQQREQVLRLVRRAPVASDESRWDPVTGLLPEAGKLNGLSAAIHLSGANLASRRWTAAYKREMTGSRVTTTRVLAEALAKLRNPPRVLIAASAVGYYGDRGDEILNESAVLGKGFLPELCAAWEAAALPAEQAGIRVVHLRFAVVLGPAGGALGKLAPMFRLGLGGPLGNGKQWMSWVSEADAVSATLFALQNAKITGPINIAAPNPVTNREFTRELGRAMHRPALIPAPAFALRLVFGEMADEALLASTRAVPQRLLEAGFQFQHPTLSQAFAAALTR